MNSLSKNARTKAKLSPFLELCPHPKALSQHFIQTIICMAQTLMVRVLKQIWSRYSCPLGFSHAAWLHNCINCISSITPMKLLSKTKATHFNLLHHVWDCPVYDIDPMLQDPKWNHRSCLDHFSEDSDVHTPLVANVHHQ